MQRIEISIIVIFILCSGCSQRDFLQGYVVLNSGDTLGGLVKDRKEGFSPRLLNPIIFKGEKRRKKFGPDAIQAYHRGGFDFHSIPFSQGNDLLGLSRISIGQHQFLKVYISDYLSLYESEWKDGNSSNFSGTYYLKREDEVQFTVVSLLGFRKKMAGYFDDASEISSSIVEKDYKFRDLFELVSDYNQWYREQE